MKDLVSKYGLKWAAIAKEMHGRTEHAVKVRWKGIINQTKVCWLKLMLLVPAV
jgi:hypothetical protein